MGPSNRSFSLRVLFLLSGLFVALPGIQFAPALSESGMRPLSLFNLEPVTMPSMDRQIQRRNSVARAKPLASSRDSRLIAETYGKLPLTFERNEGQKDPGVQFYSRGRGYTLFLTSDGAVFALASHSPAERNTNPPAAEELISPWRRPEAALFGAALLSPLISGSFLSLVGEGSTNRAALAGRSLTRPLNWKSRLGISDSANPPVSTSPTALVMKLVGSNPHTAVSGVDELPGKTNYFLGNDPKGWRIGVSNFSKVRYENIYPGVDVLYYGSQREVEYDFVVAPGADPSAISLEVAEASSRHDSTAAVTPELKIAANGDLIMNIGGGEVRAHKPLAYQPPDLGNHSRSRNPAAPGAKQLDCRYVLLDGNRVRFEIPAYDRSRPLVIDPVLSYSTLLGGSNADNGYAIAVDSSGNAYVTGSTSSTDFPTLNPIQPTLAAVGTDAFVTKLNPTGTALVYSTYLGGSGTDIGYAVTVDSVGNAYVTGSTESTDFPTSNPLQAAYGGGTSDAFVTKLNPTGTALVYSTYLGGTDADLGAGIAADSSGNAFVIGSTASTNFPTANPLQAANGGGSDAFVAKINAAGTTLLYSTYLGGSNDEEGAGIALDSLGDAYVTGVTYSTDFPTRNPFQAANGGGSDAFVAELDPAGTALLYSTFLGGSGNDEGLSIALDSTGNMYVTGSTESVDFPTVNPVQSILLGVYDAFVSELNPAGNALVYSTYFGSFNTSYSIAVDSSANAYIAGTVQPNAGFPETNSILACGQGGYLDFLAEISASGTSTVYSTCFGARLGFGMALDSSANVYLTGCADSVFFPTTAGAFQRMGSMDDCTVVGGDAFVAKISPVNATAVSLAPALLTLPDETVGSSSAGYFLYLWNVGSAPLTISDISLSGANSGDFSLLSEGQPCGVGIAGGSYCNIAVAFTPSAPGVRTASISVTDSAPGSPHTAALSGLGTAPAAGASVTPNPVGFGNENVGSSTSPQTVTVMSSGAGNLILSSASITGVFAPDFDKLSDSCSGATVTPGNTCSISIQFKPSATGGESAGLTIADNAPNSPQLISLLGTGQDFGVAVAPGTTASATVTAGGTATYILGLMPLGGFDQSVTLSCSGAPSEAICTPSQPSVVLNGNTSSNVGIMVTTTARGMLPPGGPSLSPGKPAVFLAFLLLALLVFLQARVSRVWLRPLTALAFLWIAISTACGGGGSSSPPPAGGTPAGTYTLTISGTAGSLEHSTTVALNVN